MSSPSAPTACDRVRRVTVVELPPVGNMAEGIEMGMAVPVELDAKEICCEAQERTGANVNIMRGAHIVDRRIGVVWPGLSVEGNLHRHIAAALYACCGGTHFVRCGIAWMQAWSTPHSCVHSVFASETFGPRVGES
jgi:hypothetical protein